jgi:CRISPR system Cascade subunit CasE
MRFRVVLNPVITLSKGKGKRGDVKPHVTVEHQMKFLMDRSEKNGFHLNPDEYFIVERGYSVLNKENQKPMNFIKVAYEGLLTISNLEIFKRTLTEGFGKHRAYGFGLMTVIPTSGNE